MVIKLDVAKQMRRIAVLTGRKETARRRKRVLRPSNSLNTTVFISADLLNADTVRKYLQSQSI